MMFVFRVVTRNLIMLGHHAFILFGALWWVGYVGSIHWGELALGFALSLVAAVLVVAILGAIATRFRDVPMMVTSVLPVLFFLTPIFWRADQVGGQVRWLVALNPFAVFVDLIRNPLLAQPLTHQMIVSAVSVITLLFAGYLPLYLVARRRIVYWL